MSSAHLTKPRPGTGRGTPASGDLSRYTVPALARGLHLLSYFTGEQRALSGADLVHLTARPRASVFRMLQTLEQAGYIERCGEGPVYRLGVSVLGLGFAYLAGHELAVQGQALLQALSQSSGHSAQLAIRDQREIVFIAKSNGSNAHLHTIELGARAPVHATALGSALLTGLGLAGVTQLYQDQPLARYSARTPSSLAELTAQVERDAQRGYALCEGGFEPSVSAIAAPVFNQRKQVCAAINITVLASTIAPALLPDLAQQVRLAAQTLARRLAALAPMR